MKDIRLAQINSSCLRLSEHTCMAQVLPGFASKKEVKEKRAYVAADHKFPILTNTAHVADLVWIDQLA